MSELLKARVAKLQDTVVVLKDKIKAERADKAAIKASAREAIAEAKAKFKARSGKAEGGTVVTKPTRRKSTRSSGASASA